MTNHRKRRCRRAVFLALFVLVLFLALSGAQAIPGMASRVGMTALVVVLAFRVLWWVGVDGRRPDMARIMSDRADARQVRR